ncbi:U3 small nucleolar RNA-associated protein 4 [Golovinomyces cichoracearum]|uniref:U3 small nucleolar RNA-associated protein 4 n=1 Tax=Golovinomyces cichoracearum TaxID=62708 RepID=A0A420H1R0_9PEZI|nr:U3 small nucleolar RNA-associated protein 4 [Golovinomyces cichoracearum]
MEIHRCRFVPLPPSSINALAFSHTHVTKDQITAPLRLAVGRANGDIEIWNPLKGSWLQETIIRGGKDRSIDGLVWIQDRNEEIEGKLLIGRSRLFSIGYSTTITEWNLATGQPLRQASGNHGEIWCIAAQPVLSSTTKATNDQKGQNLVVGCTDGALVLYSTQDADLQFEKLLIRPSSKKAKIISITFQDRNIVVAGCTDSTIRVLDIRSSTLLRAMTLGSGLKGGPKDIIVWAVKVLRDGTIISGDSTGELKIWDGKTFTLRQRILAHKQDILCLTTNFNGTAIFSGGMDRRTVLYKPVAKFKGRWIEVAHRRFHGHDVKAMTSFEGPGLSVFVSGGHDASPIVVPIGKYGFENQRALPFLSQDPVIRSAPKARLLVSWWDREVWIWRIDQDISSTDEDSGDISSRGRKLVAKIYIKGEANITSAAIDSKGSILVVATTSELKAFHLRSRSNSEGRGLQVSTLKLPPALLCGANLIVFSPDGKWLCIIQPEDGILLARLVQSAQSTEFLHQTTRLRRINRQIDKLSSLGGLGTYPRKITQVTFSAQSHILVLSDLAGYIDSFLLCGIENLSLIKEATEDTTPHYEETDSESGSENESERKLNPILGQSWIRNPLATSIPQLPSTPVVVSFRPSDLSNSHNDNKETPTLPPKIHPNFGQFPDDEDRLLVVTATSEVFEFEVLKGRLSDWSRRNPPAAFPKRYKMTLETVRGVIWDVGPMKERMWLYSIGWLWMFDLKRDFAREIKKDNQSSLKRKRGTCGAGSEMKNPEFNFNTLGTSTRSEDEDLNAEPDIYDDNDDMDEDDLHQEMTHMLRISRPLRFEIKANGETEDALEDLETTDKNKTAESKNVVAAAKSPSSYHTFKYRPIVGVVPIENTNTARGPEVVLVERPIWEAELPPKYYGEQEWRSREIDG